MKTVAKTSVAEIDHHSTQDGQASGEVSPVGEEGGQQDVQYSVLHHTHDQRHSDAENPDKLTRHAPWTRHPALEDDDDDDNER